MTEFDAGPLTDWAFRRDGLAITTRAELTARTSVFLQKVRFPFPPPVLVKWLEECEWFFMESLIFRL